MQRQYTRSPPFSSHVTPVILARTCSLGLPHADYHSLDLAPPPNDAISALDFSPNRPTILAVSSWDKNVRLYDTNTPEKQPITTFEHKAPVLDVCFGKDETQVFSAGLDQLVKW
jgi:WD40 repeat protein